MSSTTGTRWAVHKDSSCEVHAVHCGDILKVTRECTNGDPRCLQITQVGKFRVSPCDGVVTGSKTALMSIKLAVANGTMCVCSDIQEDWPAGYRESAWRHDGALLLQNLIKPVSVLFLFFSSRLFGCHGSLHGIRHNCTTVRWHDQHGTTSMCCYWLDRSARPQ